MDCLIKRQHQVKCMPRRRGGVLVAISDHGAFWRLKGILSLEGYTVFSAASVDEAAEVLAAAKDIFLILADYGDGGAEILSMARSRFPALKRIILSRELNLGMSSCIESCGATRCVVGPWDDGSLARCVEDAWGSFSLRMEINQLFDDARRQMRKVVEMAKGLNPEALHMAKGG